ncbi:MAG: hypothetical protein WC934_02935 [Acidithiobacillus sp.]|jgi:hypothetical protein|uniref:hypothetical protein n=1 Tax=Acidithiobacillus sp. TaxID=1872118 RepID=UPI00355D75BD
MEKNKGSSIEAKIENEAKKDIIAEKKADAIKTIPKKIQPEDFVNSIDEFMDKCVSKTNDSNICRDYVNTFYEAKRLSWELTETANKAVKRSITTWIWLLFTIIVIVLLLMFIPSLLDSILGIFSGEGDIFDLFGGGGEETTP